MDLMGSKNLKEVSDLSNATNLEKLNLSYCESLVEIPSSCSHIHKLLKLRVNDCINLQVIPANLNLASLAYVFMGGCSILRNIQVMSTNIKQLYITNTAVEDVPPSIELCSHLELLYIRGSRNFKGIPHLPTSVVKLDMSSTDIERIPDCIKDLHGLELLILSGCKRLASLPELPDSLVFLHAYDCESLETVYSLLNTSVTYPDFTNFLKLNKQARRAIIQHSSFQGKAVLPGRKVPGEFNHCAKGNTLTIPSDGDKFLFCIVISSRKKVTERGCDLSWRRIIAQDEDDPVEDWFYVSKVSRFRTEYIFLFHSSFLDSYTPEGEIVYEFSSKYHDFDIVECGAKILTKECFKASYESSLEFGPVIVEDDIEFDQVIEEDDIEFKPSEALKRRKNGDCCETSEPPTRKLCFGRRL